MQIHFKGTNYELTPAISEHATKKLQGIRKYLKKKSPDTSYVYIDLGKESEAHQNGRIWYADVNLEWQGNNFYAKATAETLETAIDQAVNDLKSELATATEKKQSLARKGGLMFKNLMQGFGR